jgi:hypothetical protein
MRHRDSCDSIRLGSAGARAFPRAAILSKPNSLNPVFTSLIKLGSTLLVGAHSYTERAVKEGLSQDRHED